MQPRCSQPPRSVFQSDKKKKKKERGKGRGERWSINLFYPHLTYYFSLSLAAGRRWKKREMNKQLTRHKLQSAAMRHGLDRAQVQDMKTPRVSTVM